VTFQAFIRHCTDGSPPVAARGWNVLRGDLPLPVLVLKQDALDHNHRGDGALLP